MSAARIAEYTQYLRRRDARLFVAVDPDSRDARRGAAWIKYQLGVYPIRIACISDFDEYRSSYHAGEWLDRVLYHIGWRQVVETARRGISLEIDRRKTGHDGAVSRTISLPA